MRGLSLVAASRGHSSLRCAGLSLLWPLLLQSTGSRHAGSVVVAHGPSCSVACGIFPDQGSNLCPLHWQADSQPLRHQGSCVSGILITNLVPTSMGSICLGSACSHHPQPGWESLSLQNNSKICVRLLYISLEEELGLCFIAELLFLDCFSCVSAFHHFPN